ncbi:hypothetical protein GCM10017778_28440 [Streptomyces vinaceus]|nr:hypothetical protein GCM10017778_28440 [Streptomyces vinaceus]
MQKGCSGGQEPAGPGRAQEPNPGTRYFTPPFDRQHARYSAKRRRAGLPRGMGGAAQLIAPAALRTYCVSRWNGDGIPPDRPLPRPLAPPISGRMP